MTENKPAIIDDIDVSECMYFKYDKSGCYIDERDCNGCDCYFKQLKRKEKLLEQAAKRINDLELAVENIEQLRDELEIKLSCEKKYSRIAKRLINLLRSKEYECEKYKKLSADLKDVNKQLGYKYLTLKQECEDLHAENKRLKRYLQEIRLEELKEMDIDWDEYETQCLSTDYTNIINLVEEALGEVEDGRF